MADVWQEEIGNPHGVKGILATPEEDDEPEVTLFGVGPPVMTNKGDYDAPSDSEKRQWESTYI